MARIVKDPEERKSELIDAAERLFTKKGYEDTTVSDIVLEIKVGQGTFYHYFRSKEEVLDAVVEMMIAPLAEEIRNISQSEGDPQEKINAILNIILKANRSEMDIMKLMPHKGNYLLHQKVEKAFRTQILPIAYEVVAKGSADGFFHAEYPEESFEFLLASALYHSYHFPWGSDRQEVMRVALEMIASRVLGV